MHLSKATSSCWQADACVWEFGGVDHREMPMQYLGLRGICYVELSVETAGTDAHSGLGGSIFPNAAWRLVWALNSLKGPDERIRIPGFYDPVKPPSARDRQLIAALPEVAEEYKQRYEIDHFLKGLTGGAGAADRRGLRAHLHDLRTDLRLPGSRLEDRAAGPRLRQGGLPPGARPAAGPGARSNCAATWTPRVSPMSRSPTWAAISPRAPIRTTRWWR